MKSVHDYLVSEKAFAIHTDAQDEPSDSEIDIFSYIASENAFPIHRDGSQETEVKNCGTGAGGFQPGNECGKGDGSGGDEDKSGSEGSSGAQSKGDFSSVAATRDSIRNPRQEMPLEAANALIDDEISKLDFTADVPEMAHSLALTAQDRFEYIIDEARNSSRWDSDDGHTIIEELGDDRSIPTMIKEKLYKAIEKQALNMAKQLGVENIIYPESESLGGREKIKDPATKAAAAMMVVRAVVRSHAIFERTAGTHYIRFVSGVVETSDGKQLPSAAGCATPDGEITIQAMRAAEKRRIGEIARPTHAFTGFEASALLHEITHVMHFNAPANASTGASRRGTKIASEPKLRAPLTSEQVRIARGEGVGARIRDYGLSNGLEYVTCFIEKLDVGGTFTPAQWKLYDEFKGPRIRPELRKNRTRTQGRDLSLEQGSNQA